MCFLQQGLRLELRGSRMLLNAKSQCRLAKEAKGRTAQAQAQAQGHYFQQSMGGK